MGIKVVRPSLGKRELKYGYAISEKDSIAKNLHEKNLGLKNFDFIADKGLNFISLLKN